MVCNKPNIHSGEPKIPGPKLQIGSVAIVEFVESSASIFKNFLHAVFGMIFLTLGYVRLVLVFFCFIVFFYKVRVVCLMSAVLRS